MSPRHKHPAAQIRELWSSAGSPRMSGILEEISLIRRAYRAHRLAYRLPAMPTNISLSISPTNIKVRSIRTVSMTRKLPHTSPAALASAPLQTAMTAAKSFMCDRIGSRRLNEVAILLPLGAGGCRARVCARRSSTLTTSSSMN